MSVYFIQRGWSGPIKIGTATDPYTRLGALQTGSPSQLRLIGIIPGGFELEGQLHTVFASARVLGEWFQPCHELLTYIGDAFLAVVVALARDRRKFWRDVTLCDLHDINEVMWASVRAGRLPMSDYDGWSAFYTTLREPVARFRTIGAAVAAGGFPPKRASAAAA